MTNDKLNEFEESLRKSSFREGDIATIIAKIKKIFCVDGMVACNIRNLAESDKPQDKSFDREHVETLCKVIGQPKPCHVCGLRKGHSPICSVSPEPPPDESQGEYCQCGYPTIKLGIKDWCVNCNKPFQPKPTEKKIEPLIHETRWDMDKCIVAKINELVNRLNGVE